MKMIPIRNRIRGENRVALPSLCLAVTLLCAAVSDAPAQPLPPPTPAELAEVCKAVEQIPPDRAKDYTFRSGVIDIDGDGTFETIIGDIRLGTMRGDNSTIRDDAGHEIELEADGYEWKDYWTFGERWMVFRGRTYQLNFADEEAGYLAYVAYVTPDRKLKVACEFDTEVIELLSAKSPRDGRVCTALEKNQIEFLPLKPANAGDQSRAAPGRRETAITQSATVDFTNEGRPQPLYLLQFESGAGRGCGADYYDTVAATERGDHGRQHRLLMDMQGINLDGTYPSQRCATRLARWFRFDGHVHLDIRYARAKPADEGDEFHDVATIEHGKVRRECSAMFSKRWRLKTMGQSPSRVQ